MRRLIWVPIIHTTADMGTMEPELRALYEEKTGTQWESHKTAVEEMWDLITDKIEQLDLDYSRVRLYQDGLPECGQELEIARDIAESGSRNHQLLLQFVDRGATLMGTESRDLLLEEYQTLQETRSPPRLIGANSRSSCCANGIVTLRNASARRSSRARRESSSSAYFIRSRTFFLQMLR
ncbi:MAG: hypothetical protein R6V58_02300 [Planctomycetota bacterium]